jgi:hypothetical protein
LAVPTNVSASVVGQSIKLTWSESTINEGGFWIRRKVDNDPWDRQYALVTNTNQTQWFDNNAAEHVYRYMISAITADTSESSQEVVIQGPPNAPSNLHIASQPTFTSVEIEWQDNSQIEDGFQIARAVDGNWNEDYDIVSQDVTQFVDTVSLIHNYIFKVRAYDQGNYSAWSGEIHYTPGALAQSTIPTISAYNNSAKIVKNGDDVYIVYVKDKDYSPNEKPHVVCCQRSTDGGSTFTEDQLGSYFYIADYPAIALDDNGNPHVVWGCITKQSGMCYRYYHYAAFDGNNWSMHSIYGNYLNFSEDPTEIHLCPPSFVIKNDSAFVLFQERYDDNGYWDGLNLIRFALSTPHLHQIDRVKHNVTYYGLRAPTLGYDPDGRLVMIYATWWESYSNFGDINFSYRNAGGSWSDPLVICETAGLPSLTAQSGNVQVCYQDWTSPNHDSLRCATLQWNGSSYGITGTSDIAQMVPEWHSKMMAYPYFADVNTVVWSSSNEVWYAEKIGPGWSQPKPISDVPDNDTCLFVQALVYYVSPNKKLFAVWTQKHYQGFYLVRDILTLSEPNKDFSGSVNGPQGGEVLYTGPFRFEAVYPNPAHGMVHVRFMSPDERHVTVKLYDVTGRIAAQLYNGPAHNGLNEIQYNGKHLASGVYFLRAQAGEELITEKVIFQK